MLIDYLSASIWKARDNTAKSRHSSISVCVAVETFLQQLVCLHTHAAVMLIEAKLLRTRPRTRTKPRGRGQGRGHFFSL